MIKDKLVAFLYLLMRDAAPSGSIVTIIRDLNTVVNHENNQYTSPELEAYARRLAEELLQ